MLKKWLVRFGLWLARLGGWKEPVVSENPPFPMIIGPEILSSARLLVEQAETIPGGGEFRRREVLRALMNRHPDAIVKDLCLAIELAVR